MINKTILVCVTVSLLARPPVLTAQGEKAGKRPRTGPSRRVFVPLDFKQMFTAGPLSDPQPPSTLLPAGATTVELTLHASVPTSCRYSTGRDRPLDQMIAFDDPQPSTSPRTVLRGLNPDPATVNDIYVRCTAVPDAVLHLQYRCLPAAKPGFPRVANLWGSGRFIPKGMAYASRIDLWLGARFTADQIRELRRLNPNCFILTSINTVENNDVPDEYFLRDTTGQKIEVWPGAYRLNLTRPEVAQYQARYAYQRMIESGLMYDGCFFDNFMMSQRWLTRDIYDRPVQLDADGDGRPDDKDAFDKAWRAGVFRELQEWRKLMPWALTSGHSQGYPYPEIAEIFNGQGIGFYTTDVIEGKKAFYELWDYYDAWCTAALKPAITSVESAVPDQIAYGYDYSPQKNTPAATWNFARDYYPYMRFGLAFTLMSDGYFSHELGDTDHGQDWWYDELDCKLGTPLGPAQQIAMGPASDRELMQNGGFEEELAGTWSLWCDVQNGCAATAGRDMRGQHSGAAAAHLTITAAGRSGGIEFTQSKRSLEQGRSCNLTFWARASHPMELRAISSKGSPNWDNYGLSQSVALTTQWQPVALTFEANGTVQDARIQFLFGGETGQVWLDEVSLKERGEEVFRRDFQHGLVLLNGTRRRQTVDVGDGFLRLQGEQAPRYQYILDDSDSEGFQTTGPWQEVELGTKEWHAIPPYYHAWNNRCHQRTGSAGAAVWDLALRGPGQYTIQAWWAAAPEAKDWTKQAVYEIMAGERVLASATLDQSLAGDQWHTIGTGVALDPQDKPCVRLTSSSGGVLVADALHVFSAERYNDGTAVRQVALEPMDGIILRRIETSGSGQAIEVSAAPAIAGQEQQWRRRICENFFVPEPMPALEASTQRRFAPAPGVRVEGVTYRTQFGLLVPALLYLPDPMPAGKIPAFIVVNGHGGDKYSWYSWYTGILFARGGAAVLTYDPVGEGERNRLHRSGTRAHDSIKGDAVLARHLAGLMITDVRQAVSYLSRRAEVDERRIAAGGYSMGSFVLALAGAVELQLRACVLVGGGNLDGPEGYWDTSKPMCQALPYRSLSLLGDRPAVIYALHAARGPTLIFNGPDDTVVAMPNSGAPFFEELRQRVARLHGSADGVFETGFAPAGAGHRPYFLTRPVLQWLEKQIDFPRWTEESIRSMPETRIGTWAEKTGVLLDKLYATEPREGGTPALGQDIPGYTPEMLNVLPRDQWESRKKDFILESWLEAVRGRGTGPQTR